MSSGHQALAVLTPWSKLPLAYCLAYFPVPLAVCDAVLLLYCLGISLYYIFILCIHWCFSFQFWLCCGWIAVPLSYSDNCPLFSSSQIPAFLDAAPEISCPSVLQSLSSALTSYFSIPNHCGHNTWRCCTWLRIVLKEGNVRHSFFIPPASSNANLSWLSFELPTFDSLPKLRRWTLTSVHSFLILLPHPSRSFDLDSCSNHAGVLLPSVSLICQVNHCWSPGQTLVSGSKFSKPMLDSSLFSCFSP